MKPYVPGRPKVPERQNLLGLWVSKGIVQKYEGSISMHTSARRLRPAYRLKVISP
ncbi:MAG: hypothetical protein WCA44_15585 [Acidobacteriaceae bacterium]